MHPYLGSFQRKKYEVQMSGYRKGLMVRGNGSEKMDIRGWLLGGNIPWMEIKKSCEERYRKLEK